MKEEHTWDDTIEAAIRTLARVPSNPHSTIEPSAKHASKALEELKASGTRFKPRSTLGEGGMGIVHLAEQLTLGRDVAIKTLKPEHSTPQAVLKLVQEAWVTGTLEHPNVVPVYDIDFSGDEGDREQPRIILKKIEGQVWGELMRDAERVRREYRAPDLLEWNIRRVIDVCQALRYAHSRGIVHRDIKPENVMIGSFGEVYVLDWGIAVALEDDGTGRFPLASDAKEMAGTPCCMSPEQLGGEDPNITPRTDIYLVGAMLYEMVTGLPPHTGDTFREILASVLQSNPYLPDDVPEDLARIIRRAMDPDPDARFETAEQLQLALEGFLAHRGSSQLAEQGDDAAKRMVQAIDAGEDDLVEALYAECAFAYQAALRAWEQNEPARLQLQRVTILRIDHELENDEVGVAARLMSTMDSPPEALVRRVKKAQAAAEAAGELHRRMEQDASHDVGKRTRTFVALIMATLWSGISLKGVIQPFTWIEIVLGTGALIVLLLALGYWARESFSKTRLNRSLGSIALGVSGVQLLLLYGAYVSGLELVQTEVLLLFLWAAGAVLTVATTAWQLWPAMLGYSAGFVVSAWKPELRYWMMGASHALLWLNLVWFNRAISVFHEVRQERRGRRRLDP